MRRASLVGSGVALFIGFQACGGSAVSNGAGGAGIAGHAGSSSGAAGGALSGSGSANDTTAGKASNLPPKPVGGEDGGAPAAGGTAGAPTMSGDEGGAFGVAGESGATNCEPLLCAAECPSTRWQGVDGCPTCACAPPPTQLSRDAFACPEASLTLKTETSWFIGGIDRWLLDFTWSCGAGSIGEPGRATLRIGIIQPPQTPIDEISRTVYFGMPQPPAGGDTREDYELRGATGFLRGSGVPEISEPLSVVSGFISLRREGNELVGGVLYVGESATQSHTTTLSGPFRAPVPQR
jgi:hypothetical protein